MGETSSGDMPYSISYIRVSEDVSTTPPSVRPSKSTGLLSVGDLPLKLSPTEARREAVSAACQCAFPDSIGFFLKYKPMAMGKAEQEQRYLFVRDPGDFVIKEEISDGFNAAVVNDGLFKKGPDEELVQKMVFFNQKLAMSKPFMEGERAGSSAVVVGYAFFKGVVSPVRETDVVINPCDKTVVYAGPAANRFFSKVANLG